jgi:hypothetical protein
MKRNLLRFAPWVALMVVGVVGTPKMANTAPPPERHPHIRAAADALREAEEELRTGATDFCGHKAAAMRDVGAAEKQLRAALACDRR